MTKLSVNINKIATIRNARGGNMPDIIKTALDCEQYGAQGITVHPRPDERHITYNDVYKLSSVLSTEFNIEGNPIPKFIELVNNVKPSQVTLVPDSPDVLTSNAGWDTIKHYDFLKDIVSEFKNNGIRTSIFIETDSKMIENAAKLGTDRVELYTESYVDNYSKDPKQAILPFYEASLIAKKCGLGLNAGHDLNLENLNYFIKNTSNLLEVSIGHALICDALYFGLEATIGKYLNEVRR